MAALFAILRDVSAVEFLMPLDRKFDARRPGVGRTGRLELAVLRNAKRNFDSYW